MENAKKDTKCPDSIEAVEGFDSIKEEDKEEVKKLIQDFAKFREDKFNKSKSKTKKPKDQTKPKSEIQKSNKKTSELNITFGQVKPKKTVQDDILGLKKVIPQPWADYLLKTIYDLEDNTKYISSEDAIPSKNKLFESLSNITPQSVKLIIFGPSPLTNSESASGYSFCDSTIKYFNQKLPTYLENIINAAKIHSSNFGYLSYLILSIYNVSNFILYIGIL